MVYKDKFNRWLESEVVDEKTKVELRGICQKEIEDRFSDDLEFGTGGLRGVMAAGTNRMNVYTVRLASTGLAMEILSHGEEFTAKGIVIAYDTRNNSNLFAQEAASVFLANGIKTYLFDEQRPTPELSFAVRHLGCARGVVITASHNPKEYNGYKVYGEDGGQITDDSAGEITSFIRNTDIFSDIKITDKKPIIIGKEIDDEYIKAIKKQVLTIDIPSDFKVVYTPIHGTGNKLVRRILSEIGVKNVFTVPEQEAPDGDFPTVNSPNPENHEVFNIAIKYAYEQDADIIIGTDPDSDRIGVVVRNSDGEFVTLNGNQTGCIMAEYILRKSKENGLLTKSTIVKTIVTTEMVRNIAKDYGIECIDVLTGFKYIGDVIKRFEENGEEERFIFGLEESYGYLKGTYVRDKDAVVAAMIICEAAADYKRRDLTLYDGLISLYEKYGFFKEELETKTLKGIDGLKKIQKIMDEFRNESLPFDVFEKIDYKNGIGGLPEANVLKFMVKDGWFAVRPSGTEPKIKFYFEVCAEDKITGNDVLTALKESVLKNVGLCQELG